jgi:trehalose 6-phosphate phosphatase
MAGAELPASLDPFGPMLRDPSHGGLFVDFDGTLAAIVEDPASSRPLPGIAAALAQMADRLAIVGVVSGRPVEFLTPFFAPSIHLAGLYGLETRVGEEHAEHPAADTWRDVIARLASDAIARGPAGMRVESKGLSLTLHYRGAPHLEHDVRAWAEQHGAAAGLSVRPAKMSYELHPPIEIDKGTTLLAWADGLRSVAFIGDDLGDLPAFDALDTLAARGVVATRVGVRTTETAPELLRRADVIVDGPPGVADLLTLLQAAAR